MTFLPVVQRELLVAARSATVRWQRFAAIALGIAVFLVVLATTRRQPTVVSERLFYGLSGLLCVLAWLSGPLYTADTLTREKREGTLGLLFLTDLHGYDVVLGKLAATALHQVMLLVGVFPVLALPVAMGGIAAAEFWRMVVALLLTQGVSLIIGMSSSAMAPSFGKSVRSTLSFLGALTFTPVALYLACLWLKRPTFPWVLGLSPLLQVLSSFEEYRRSRPEGIAGWDAGVPLLSGLIVFGLGWACFWVQRRREEPQALLENHPPENRASHPLTGWRNVHWSEWLDRNPYYWLERTCRPEKGTFNSLIYLFIGAATVGLVISWWRQGTPVGGGFFLMSLGLAYIAHQLLKLSVCLSATRRLGEDRRTGALELLLTTPLSPKDLVEGSREALMAEAFAPMVALSLLAIIQFLSVWFGPILQQDRAIPVVVVGLFSGLGMLFLDIRWGILIGLRTSLRDSDPMRAFRRTVLRLLVPGWVGVPSILLITIGTSEGAFIFMYLLVYGICLLISAWHARRAQIDLDHGLREIAAGLNFDTNERELAEDFRKAAMTWEDRWFNRR